MSGSARSVSLNVATVPENDVPSEAVTGTPVAVSSFGSASASVSGNVTNDGTIRLETIDSPSYSETLNVGGVLTNSSTGVIQVNAGAGGDLEKREGPHRLGGALLAKLAG